MQSRSPINLGSRHRSNLYSARIVHASTCLDMTIALLKVVPKIANGRPSQFTTSVDNQLKGMCGQYGRKGKKAAHVGVNTEEPPCDEIFQDDIHAPHTNEAYTTVCLPASASNKGMTSLWVKVYTEASGNVLPVHLFKCLYPDHINKTGHLTGLHASNSKLTVYNGTLIPLFRSLHGPINW